MKYFFGVLILLILFNTSGVAQPSEKTTISVTGTAEIRVSPDEVVFSMDVTQQHKDLQTAKKANDEAVSKILATTRKFSIGAQNVQTNYIAVDMKYENIRDPRKLYDEDGTDAEKRIFRGYVVSKTVVVRLTDITKFEEFFSEILKTGVSEVRNLRFETSKLREYRDKAREQAMKAAKEKAAAMAGAIGQTIGKALSISENSTPSYHHFSPVQNVMNYSAASGGTSEGSETFAPGTIKVEANVTVVFELK